MMFGAFGGLIVIHAGFSMDLFPLSPDDSLMTIEAMAIVIVAILDLRIVSLVVVVDRVRFNGGFFLKDSGLGLGHFLYRTGVLQGFS